MVESQKVMGTGRSDPTPPSEGMGALTSGTDYNQGPMLLTIGHVPSQA